MSGSSKNKNTEKTKGAKSTKSKENARQVKKTLDIPPIEEPKSRKAGVIVFLVLLLLSELAYIGYRYLTVERVEFHLMGESTIALKDEERFSEPGFFAETCDKLECRDISEYVSVIGEVPEKVVGEFRIEYELDYKEEKRELERTISVTDTEAPVLTLAGEKEYGFRKYEEFSEPGVTAVDNFDGDLTGQISVDGEVDMLSPGAYKIKYSVADKSGNTATAERMIFVYDYYAVTARPTGSFQELEEYIEENGLDVAFGYVGLNNDKEYYRQADRVFYGASLVKTVDAMYMYEKNVFPSGSKWLLANAITYSRNDAHMELVKMLGKENLKTYAKEIGMKYHLEPSSIYTDAYYFCDTTVEDQLAAFIHLYELTNTLENGWELKNYYLNNYWHELRFLGIPDTMSKNGLYGKYYHESGVVLDEEPYAVAILTTDGLRWNSTYIMKDLSHRIFMIHQMMK